MERSPLDSAQFEYYFNLKLPRSYEMLFPDFGPEFYDEKGRDLLSRMTTTYNEGLGHNQSYWADADLDTRFECGDQTLWREIYGAMGVDNIKAFSFNRIRRIVNMTSGYQRRNRKSTVVVPIEANDTETADQFTKILMWSSQQEGVLDTISQAFHGALVTGMNMLQIWVDYREDPISGEIKVDNCPYNSLLVDPFFRKADLSDCNSIWKRSYLTRRECISLMPGKRAEIEKMRIRQTLDGKFNFMPENTNIGFSDLLSYDEYYYKSSRKRKMLVDITTEKTQEWKGSDERLGEYLRLFPQLGVIESEIPTVKLAVVVGGKVLYDGKNPLGIDSYPFVPVLGYYNPQVSDYSLRIQGMVRGLRDAQFLYNRRKILDLEILESQLNSGWITKEGTVVDRGDLYATGTGKGITLKKHAQMTDLVKIAPAAIPPSNLALTDSMGKEVMEISGANEEMVGSAVDDKAGVLAKLRQGAGLTTLQTLFDQLDNSQKLLGRKMISVIQENFTPGKVMRITGEQPTQQFYDKSFGKYDAAVEEGINSTTQRQLQFAQLLHLKEAGLPIPDDVIIKASTMQNKNDVLKSIAEETKRKSQLEEMQFNATMQEQQSRIELAQARAKADEGLGIERVSRVEENRAFAVERIAEAKKDRTQGILNIVKAISELDDMELSQMEKMLAMSGAIREAEKVTGTPSAQPLTGAQPVAGQI